MHAGDGTLYRTNSNSVVWELRGGFDEVDYYDHWVKPLVRTLFDVEVFPKARSGGGNGSFGVRSCSRNLTGYLQQYFPVGAKSRVLRVPGPVLIGNNELIAAFLRGVFDTDGCVALEKTKKGVYPKIQIATVSREFHNELMMLMRRLSFVPRFWRNEKSGMNTISLSGFGALEKWCVLVDSHNAKHLNKIRRAFASAGKNPHIGVCHATVAQPGTAADCYKIQSESVR